MGAAPATTRPLQGTELLQQWLANHRSRALEDQIDRAILRTTTRALTG